MKKHHQTSMGGVGEAFLTTHWSLIDQAQSQEEGKRALIGQSGVARVVTWP